MKLRPRPRTVLIVIAFVLFASALGFQGSLLYTRHRAVNLLKGAQKLKLGESTTEDVQKLFREYGTGSQESNDSICSGPDCFFYSLAVYNRPLEYLLQTRWFVSHVRTIWTNSCCGLTGWRGLVAGIHVSEGRVVAIDVGIGTRRSDGFLMSGRVQVVKAIPEAFDKLRVGYRPGSFHLTTPGGGAGVEAMIDLRADASARQHAFDFNLQCMSSWSGCTEFSEIMPSVWSDLQEYLRQRSPPEGK